MTSEDSEDPKPTDAEELVKSLTENRKERMEQVSFEWVETVREAGELYRRTEDIDSVAERLDLSKTRASEALTVYRLIFQEESNSAIRSVLAGQTYFSLEQDIEEDYEEEEEADYSLEELLCEYVGALYLDYDIEEQPVGNPPEKAEPDDLKSLDFSVLAESVTPPAAFFSALSEAISPQKALLNNFTHQILPSLEKITENYVNAVNPLPGLMFQIEELSEAQETLIAQVIAENEVPNEFIADLANVRSAVDDEGHGSIDTTENTDIVGDQSPPSGADIEDNDKEYGEVDEPVTASANLRGQGSMDVHVVGNPTTPTSEIDFSYELPAVLTESILTGPKTFRWFAKLEKEYQDAVVSFLLISITIWLGYPSFAPAAPAIAPAIRTAVLESDEHNDSG